MLIRYGEFLSQMDELVASKADHLLDRLGLWINRRDLVLRHAEIYARWLSTGPTGAVPA